MYRVLIIDDDPDWCEGALKNPLLSLGYEITTVQDRKGALRYVQEERFDLAVINIRLDFGITDDKITAQWTELLDLATGRGTDVIVVTSRSYPPEIELTDLQRMAFKDFAVADFLVKEKLNVREYRRIVQETVEKRPEPRQPIAAPDRAQLIDQLARDPTWQTGGHRARIRLLQATGLPEAYVLRWQLDGPPHDAAASVISALEGIGHLADNPEYCGLGLLARYLYGTCPDLEGQRFLSRFVLDYHLTTDEAWLSTLR